MTELRINRYMNSSSTIQKANTYLSNESGKNDFLSGKQQKIKTAPNASINMFEKCTGFFVC